MDADRVGERVIVDFSIYNRPEGDESLADIDYIGHGRDGGYAEYVAVPAENAYRTDAPIDDAELATFCCAYLTAEQMLDRARLASGRGSSSPVPPAASARRSSSSRGCAAPCRTRCRAAARRGRCVTSAQRTS